MTGFNLLIKKFNVFQRPLFLSCFTFEIQSHNSESSNVFKHYFYPLSVCCSFLFDMVCASLDSCWRPQVVQHWFYEIQKCVNTVEESFFYWLLDEAYFQHIPSRISANILAPFLLQFLILSPGLFSSVFVCSLSLSQFDFQPSSAAVAEIRFFLSWGSIKFHLIRSGAGLRSCRWICLQFTGFKTRSELHFLMSLKGGETTATSSFSFNDSRRKQLVWQTQTQTLSTVMLV